eukprot:comp12425_c0_seq1/m.7334 comp12425_c0_seq1/g.7334  ORF comp12425_c0_seq1/g.7334 comp12425_c0_seq1/m.7334 type:complete len:217 (-) comp12425_c0_seq1:615-1265(-)
MKDYQTQFIELAVKENALGFGEFTLKSGRKSPYFFNFGLFNGGKVLASLGQSYAAAVVDANIEHDVMFGPAYKGIPLVAATVMSLARDFDRDTPYCFNRKEAKDHGEGGSLVGASLKGKRVLIVDDVITAGTAIREAIEIITKAGGTPVGVVVCLDRQERGKGETSAIQEVEQQYGLKVASIVQLDQIIEYINASGDTSLKVHLTAISAYKAQYGV